MLRMAIPKIERDYEEESTGEFMHRPGELFWRAPGDPNTLHVLDRVKPGLNTDNLPGEVYVAGCGVESQSWSAPQNKLEPAEFIPYTDALASGAKLCEGCFHSEES